MRSQGHIADAIDNIGAALDPERDDDNPRVYLCQALDVLETLATDSKRVDMARTMLEHAAGQSCPDCWEQIQSAQMMLYDVYESGCSEGDNA